MVMYSRMILIIQYTEQVQLLHTSNDHRAAFFATLIWSILKHIKTKLWNTSTGQNNFYMNGES